jgi:lipoyl(octanoyl) transferase
LKVLDLGRMGYQAAWDRQLEVHAEVSAGGEDTLILVEHPAVFTLGANFHVENLRYSEAELVAMGNEIVRTDRGGDVTFHGPNQQVIYPIFDLNRHGKDLHRFIRNLEETMLLTLREFGIEGRRFPPHTGAWIGDEKVAAIGIKVKRWVSLHGIALNCNNDLEPFSWIVPCGIQGYGVTSLSRDLGREVTIQEAQPVIVRAFQSVFPASG